MLALMVAMVRSDRVFSEAQKIGRFMLGLRGALEL